jgi:hypothetical protein
MLLANRIITPDGTVLQSLSTHHYCAHRDRKTDEVYFTDGGLSYVRRSVNKVPATVADVYSDSPFSEIRSAFHWGTRGEDGMQPLQYVPLKDLTTEHIRNILMSQTHLVYDIVCAFIQEIQYRQYN